MESKLKSHTVSIILITVLGLLVSLPGAFSSSPVYSDGQRYVFNGILLHDLIRDRGFFEAYEYAKNFYAHYPSTNLPFGPPVFALIFAIAFAVLGISFTAARLVIAGATIMAGLSCYLVGIKLFKSKWIGLFSTLIFILNPISIVCARDPGPEIPVSIFCILSLYFFYFFVEEEKKYYSILSALILGFGYLTKQYIVPLGFALPLYLIYRRKFNLLLNVEIWISVLIVLLLTVPYTMLSFKYGNAGHGFIFLPPPSMSLAFGYPLLFLKEAPILMIGAMIGFYFGIKERNKFVVFCLIWTITWYVFFTFFYGYYIFSRYFSSFLLCIIYPVSYGLVRICNIFQSRIPFATFSIFFFVFLISNGLSQPVHFIRGYEEAGKYIANNYEGKSVLFYGTYEGAFMMGVRKRIDKAGPYILRGERTLSVRVWHDAKPLDVRVNKEEDILELLNNSLTGHIVFEKDMPTAEKNQDYKLLKAVLENSDLFEVVKNVKISVDNARKNDVGTELIIYKYLGLKYAVHSQMLEIYVPTLNSNISVPLLQDQSNLQKK